MTHRRSRESVGKAIAVMATWLERQPEPDASVIQTAADIVQTADDPMTGYAELVVGLANLCGHLLVLRELEREIPEVRTLEQLAAASQ